jgi:hypothetical protein
VVGRLRPACRRPPRFTRIALAEPERPLGSARVEPPGPAYRAEHPASPELRTGAGGSRAHGHRTVSKRATSRTTSSPSLASETGLHAETGDMFDNRAIYVSRLGEDGRTERVCTIALAAKRWSGTRHVRDARTARPRGAAACVIARRGRLPLPCRDRRPPTSALSGVRRSSGDSKLFFAIPAMCSTPRGSVHPTAAT